VTSPLADLDRLYATVKARSRIYMLADSPAGDVVEEEANR
jgi:hypothetical protein